MRLSVKRRLSAIAQSGLERIDAQIDWSRPHPDRTPRNQHYNTHQRFDPVSPRCMRGISASDSRYADEYRLMYSPRSAHRRPS